MTPAQQFMDALVKFGGESLVIGSDEPPFIWRNEKKGYLLREPLKDDQFRKIDQELLAAFAGKEWVSYLGQEIGHSRENGAIHLTMAAGQPLAGARENGEAPLVPAAPTLDGLLGLMVGKKASDLHLSTGCPPYLRVDGEIEVDRRPAPRRRGLAEGADRSHHAPAQPR